MCIYDTIILGVNESQNSQDSVWGNFELKLLKLWERWDTYDTYIGLDKVRCHPYTGLYSMCTQGGAPKRFFGIFQQCTVPMCRKCFEYNFYLYFPQISNLFWVMEEIIKVL